MLTTLFLICAMVGGIVLLFQALLIFVGFGGDEFDIDADADIDFDTDLDIGDQAEATSAFRILSFRTVVAGLAFFGMAGLAAQSAELGPVPEVSIGLATGAAAMYAVFWMMQSINKLKADGTAHIRNTVGSIATVYLRIPADRSGTGKIQINLQNRTMEYLALTPGDEVPTGAKVVVTSVVSSDTVEVEPAVES